MVGQEREAGREEEMEGTGTVLQVLACPPGRAWKAASLAPITRPQRLPNAGIALSLDQEAEESGRMKVVSLVRCWRSLHAALLPPAGLWSRLSNTGWSDMSHGILRWRVWATLATAAAARATQPFDRLPCAPPACSGGKDSCYNMVLCQKYGHEVGERF